MATRAGEDRLAAAGPVPSGGGTTPQILESGRIRAGSGGGKCPRNPGGDLEHVVERRLRRSAAEKNAMRAVVLGRLVERELALKLALAAASGKTSDVPPSALPVEEQHATTAAVERAQNNSETAPSAGVLQINEPGVADHSMSRPSIAESTDTKATTVQIEKLALHTIGDATTNTISSANIANDDKLITCRPPTALTSSPRDLLHSPRQPPVGPWEASMRINPQLNHVRRIRQLEDEATKRLERQRLEESRKESRKRELATRARRRQQSMNVKAHVIAGREDRRRREAAALEEIEKKSQQIAKRRKHSEDQIASTKAAMARAQRKKAWLRGRRAARVHERREERARADYVKRMAIMERMHVAMQSAHARIGEVNDERKVGASRDRDRRDRAEKFVTDSLQASARELAAREAHRREVMALCVEKQRERVSGLVQKNRERSTRAIRERTKQERVQDRRKAKLAQEKQKRFQAITVERARQQYLGDELRRQIDDRDAELRNFAAGMLGTVDHITSIEELRSMAAQLEGKYAIVAQAQESESWNAYRSAAALKDQSALVAAKSASRVFSRPTTSFRYSRPQTSGRQRRRGGRSKRGTSGTTSLKGGGGSIKGIGNSDSSTVQVVESVVPMRPRTAGASGDRQSQGKRGRKQRWGRGGRAGRFAHHHRSPSRPGSGRVRRAGVDATGTMGEGTPLKHHYGTGGKGGICALCRHRFALLPCRVMRKAVVEMRAEMGIHNRNIHRWKTAVLYDQVPVCTFCSQWLLPGGMDGNCNTVTPNSRLNSLHGRVRRHGPIRKSVDQLDNERDRRLTHELHRHSREASKHTGSNIENKIKDADMTHSSKQDNLSSNTDEVDEEVEVSVSVRIHGGGRYR